MLIMSLLKVPEVQKETAGADEVSLKLLSDILVRTIPCLQVLPYNFVDSDVVVVFLKVRSKLSSSYYSLFSEQLTRVFEEISVAYFAWLRIESGLF